jgi:hypothetical protein
MRQNIETTVLHFMTGLLFLTFKECVTVLSFCLVPHVTAYKHDVHCVLKFGRVV